MYGCYNPPIPSGTAAQPTRILGRNWANCSIGEGVFKVPDPAKVSTLVGGLAVGCALALSNTDYVDVQCLELTRQSNCTSLSFVFSPQPPSPHHLPVLLFSYSITPRHATWVTTKSQILRRSRCRRLGRLVHSFVFFTSSILTMSSPRSPSSFFLLYR